MKRLLDPVAFGGTADPSALARSPQFRDGVFHNPTPPRWVPSGRDMRKAMREMLAKDSRQRPRSPIPLVKPVFDDIGSLALTWFGHASSLVQIDGARILIDPMFSGRASPSQLVGPGRLHPTPCTVEELVGLDAIVISHDHYDHLDMSTVRALNASSDAPFVTPLGVGAHLRRWGVAAERIVELDWWEHTDLDGVRLTCTPAQHFSGRGLRRNQTLWGSWVIAGAREKLFYSADSGYFDGFRAIGDRYGPFDVALMQIGAYNVAWPDVHMTPEEGVQAHRDVGGGLVVPVHWGTFNLAPHPWAEPPQRLRTAAAEHGVRVAVPRPGERVVVAEAGEPDDWWSAIA